MYAYAVLIIYSTVLSYALIYFSIQVYKFIIDKTLEVKHHRLEHIKLLLLIALFNFTLLGTDLSNGIDSFIFHLSEKFSPMPFQYVVMTMFLYFALEHLDYEIEQLEEYYDK